MTGGALGRDSRRVTDLDNVDDVELKITNKEGIFVTERKAERWGKKPEELRGGGGRGESVQCSLQNSPRDRP